jgi:hypothetical protein
LGGGSESTTIEELAVGWHPPATNSAKIAKALSHLAILGLFQVRISGLYARAYTPLGPPWLERKFISDLYESLPGFLFYRTAALVSSTRGRKLLWTEGRCEGTHCCAKAAKELRPPRNSI